MQESMFSSEGPPVSRFQSQALERDWLTRVATLPSLSLRSLHAIAPSGWYGRTSPACFQTRQALSEPSSVDWQNSGMGGPTEFWTLNLPEFHSGAVACSLSDILETGDVPQRYFLSATACKGILRRAAKRGKDLPQQLAHALKAVADSARTSTVTEGL